MIIKDKGEQAFEERKAVLTESEKRMEEISAKLLRLQQQVSSS